MPDFVVCGDNPLAFRLVNELVTRFGSEVGVIMPKAHRNQGPQIATLPGVHIVEAARPDEAALRAAGVVDAQALALVQGDDVDTIHAALAANELNPDIRLVIRMNPRLGARIRSLFPDCAVLSATQLAAPSFVAAALGEHGPNLIEMDDATLYSAPRAEVALQRVICGLAAGDELFPSDIERADLVLALADGDPPPRWRNRQSQFLRQLRMFLRYKLVLLAVILGIMVATGFVLMATVGHQGWSISLYQTLLDAAGDTTPDNALSPFNKAMQVIVAFAGLALIPVGTAVAVDGLLRARLADQGIDPGRMSGHVVVVGLGSVGSRVITQLHDLGVPVVGVDVSENARGVGVANRLRIPVVFGDATWATTLRAAGVARAQSLAVLTNSDVVNIEAALLGRTYREDLRVVLRLFDDDLAERVQRRLHLVSRSVSRLAAASFAAAMVEREVIGTISVGRSALMIAEVPVDAGSALVGLALHELDVPGEARIVAVQHGPDQAKLWRPRPGTTLTTGDRIVVAATRAGLGLVLAHSIPPETQAEVG